MARRLGSALAKLAAAAVVVAGVVGLAGGAVAAPAGAPKSPDPSAGAPKPDAGHAPQSFGAPSGQATHPRPPTAAQRAAVAGKKDDGAKEIAAGAVAHIPLTVTGGAPALVVLILPAGVLTVSLREDDYHAGMGRMRIAGPTGAPVCEGAQGACDIEAPAAAPYRFTVINLARGTGDFTIVITPPLSFSRTAKKTK